MCVTSKYICRQRNSEEVDDTYEKIEQLLDDETKYYILTKCRYWNSVCNAKAYPH